MKLIGTYSHPDINDSKPIPLYELTGDINTLEGWNRYVLEGSIRNFTKAHGRPPINDEEALEYNRKLCQECIADSLREVVSP